MAQETTESTVTEVEPQETAVSEQPSPESDNTTITDRPALESKVKAGLDALFRSDETDEDKETADDGRAAQVAAATEKTEKKEPTEAAAEETDKTVDQDGEPTEKVETKAVDAPTLPAAYVRTLKAYGWTDEDISTNMKVIGPKMLDIAAKLHATRSQETSQWAEAGRQARQQQNPRQENGQFAARQPQGPQVIKPVDIAALKKQYGDDGLIDAIAAPVNAAIEQINQLVPGLQQSTEQAQRAQLETLNRQIEGFFTGNDMEAYKELYGNANESALNADTITARNKVLEFADALIVGAKAQNRNLSLGEALTLAHDSVSGDFKKVAARKELVGTLKVRSKGITIRPTGKRPNVAGGQVTRDALNKKVKAGLAAVFNS